MLGALEAPLNRIRHSRPEGGANSPAGEGLLLALDEGEALLDLPGGGIPRHKQLVGTPDKGLGIASLLRQETAGKNTSLPVKECAVEQHQGLRRHRGDRTHTERPGGVGIVKALDQRHQGPSLGIDIHAPAGLLLTVGNSPAPPGSRTSGYHLPAELWKETAATHIGIQSSCGEQDRVPDRLGLQALHVLPPEEPVGGIFAQGLALFNPRGHAVSPREHDQLLQALDLPPAKNKVACEPVQQLGMGRRQAPAAEIVRSPDDSTPEKMLPDPVHHHPGRQEIAVSSDPFSKGTPQAGRGFPSHGLCLPPPEHGREGGLDQLAGGRGITSNQDLCLLRLIAMLPHRKGPLLVSDGSIGG